MKINHRLLIISFLFMFSLTGMSQPEGYTKVSDIDMLKHKLALQAEETNSIESNFIQEKHLWMLEEVLISEGRFLFQKENNVRWQYDTPVEYLILIHNGKFSIVSNGKVNEFDIESNPMFRQINNMIVAAIRGDFMSNNDFESQFFEDPSSYLSVLIPKINAVSSMLSSIEIYFGKDDMQVNRVIFKEPGDDMTIISFIDKKINSDIPEKEFVLDK